MALVAFYFSENRQKGNTLPPIQVPNMGSISHLQLPNPNPPSSRKHLAMTASDPQVTKLWDIQTKLETNGVISCVLVVKDIFDGS